MELHRKKTIDTKQCANRAVDDAKMAKATIKHTKPHHKPHLIVISRLEKAIFLATSPICKAQHIGCSNAKQSVFEAHFTYLGIEVTDTAGVEDATRQPSACNADKEL